MTSAIDLVAVDQLQARYIRALDAQDMQGWMELFADSADASYICTTREHVKNNLPIAMMLDDCRTRIQDRVTYVTRIWAGTFQNYQTRHLTQRLWAEPEGEGTIRALSSFVVYSTAEEDGAASVLTTGEYEDVIVSGAEGLRFLSKKAVLDTSVLPRYIVYPI